MVKCSIPGCRGGSDGTRGAAPRRSVARAMGATLSGPVARIRALTRFTSWLPGPVHDGLVPGPCNVRGSPDGDMPAWRLKATPGVEEVPAFCSSNDEESTSEAVPQLQTNPIILPAIATPNQQRTHAVTMSRAVLEPVALLAILRNATIWRSIATTSSHILSPKAQLYQ